MKDFNTALNIAIDENPANDPSLENLPRTEAISLFKKKWHPDRRVLHVDFLSQPAYIDNVISAAKGWEPFIGIKFLFGQSDPDILVNFEEGGSWSYIGTDSRYFSARGRPSMNFGWFDASTDKSEFHRTTLHEFGHALSLVHEQSHPGAHISWKEAEVFAYYAKLGWSKDDVREQVFAKYELSQVNGSNYDPTSIMHYPIPKELVSDLNDVVGWNTELSQLDKTTITTLYPKSLSGGLPK
ncbi:MULTISPECIES: M12 family metallopeptidase [unclassified Mesorhizobium]|uniref:M12 family metallopeptidase n=1 Tax=unclassified Mesorhizobium TaxID=325217 RepID=UPI00333A7E8F